MCHCTTGPLETAAAMADIPQVMDEDVVAADQDDMLANVT